jgi:hypothetical protein
LPHTTVCFDFFPSFLSCLPSSSSVLSFLVILAVPSFLAFLVLSPSVSVGSRNCDRLF